MRRSIRDVIVGATIGALAAGALSHADSMARAMGRGVRLPGRSISVTLPRVTAGQPSGRARGGLEVKVHSAGPRSLVVARSDFSLSAGGDMFAARGWNAERSRVTIAPGTSRAFRLTFHAPSAAVKHGTLFYRSTTSRVSGMVPLTPSVGPVGASDLPLAKDQPVIKTFPVTAGVGEPWGTATDSSGNIWFAEPGCDFAPSCSSNTPPGQIGRLDPSSGAVKYYPLPGISGNQPIFLAFDGSGDLWFTTPNNSMIGEFRPSTETFIGQWPVTAGSGPWGLAFANGQIWYTEHFASAIGRFGPATHDHQDFPTPSANSNPYGITANGDRIWFTENNSDVDRVAVLDTANPTAISEYPIVRPLSGTPHLIAMDANGRPWWTEGFSNTIATLDPAAATPGSCGTSSGVCTGVHRFQLPASSTCGGSAHTSGIAFQASANLVWLDNSLTAEVGSFAPSTAAFAMHTLSDCSAHPHDGLILDAAGNVWFDEEFANAIGELIPATGGSGTGSASAPTADSTPPPATSSSQAGSSEPGPAGSSREQVNAAIAKLLGLRECSIAKLRKRGRCTVRFDAPSAGSLSASWHAIARGVHRAKRGATKTPRPALFATARGSFPAAGVATVTIRLARTGKRLLERAKTMSVTANGTFVPTGESAVAVVKRFTLRASRRSVGRR